MDFKDKVIIITGATAGIGLESAKKYAARGARVVLNGQNAERGQAALEQVQAAGPGPHLLLTGDVSRAEVARSIAERTFREFGRIDILVNNAGIVPAGAIDETTEEEWVRAMDVNVKSVFEMSRSVLPYMKEQKSGVIVNTASSVAHKGVRDRAAYSASKGAVLSMTRAMAMDLISFGIRVNSVSPGTTDTPSLAQRLSRFADPVKARADFTARQPMGRLGRAEEIAEAILFASSDEAAFMNGADVRIDGAMTC